LFFIANRRRHSRFSRDWNSDVCSSDLKQVRLNNAGVVFKDYTNFYTFPRSSDGKLINGAYNRAWKQDKYVGTIPVNNIPKIADKIGRASCRERVCINVVSR